MFLDIPCGVVLQSSVFLVVCSAICAELVVFLRRRGLGIKVSRRGVTISFADHGTAQVLWTARGGVFDGVRHQFWIIDTCGSVRRCQSADGSQAQFTIAGCGGKSGGGQRNVSEIRTHGVARVRSIGVGRGEGGRQREGGVGVWLCRSAVPSSICREIAGVWHVVQHVLVVTVRVLGRAGGILVIESRARRSGVCDIR